MGGSCGGANERCCYSFERCVDGNQCKIGMSAAGFYWGMCRASGRRLGSSQFEHNFDEREPHQDSFT